ncbi:putative lipoprotein [Hyphomonas neptunium ATCC 15444]|uniref:Putative lipoprotein n=2 Tax=Hyphomonas TaxID=85 RepID=Q0C466_HYPNA|nr:MULTISPECIES: hypothetical protein [Hyphomonas]ABI77226.1 putative lipoprotein [Hyphomonas neptunium ATCC 15444]KCZ96311.1 putative lipoprotein [Hyphomonas hirschiana VP5]
MKLFIACAMAALIVAPAAFACESYVADVNKAGLAVKSANNERMAVQTQFEDGEAGRSELRREIDAQGNTPARQAELDGYKAAIRKAELAWTDRQPEWDAAEAELMTAIDAHEGACGANARTGVLIEELGLKLNR